MQKINFFVWVSVLALLLVGCASNDAKSLEDYRMPTELPVPSSLTEAAQTETASSIQPANCPVTKIALPSFEAPTPLSPKAPWPGIFWFGSENLWTALHENGVWASLPKSSDGYTQKIMWWSRLYSLPDEPQPALVVTGRRLDAEAPPLRFYGATNAMADDIGEAMLTGVEFPTLGCWEIQGQYKKTSLTFVVQVMP